MTLLMVSLDKRRAVWCHPLEAATRCQGWTDCTHMDEAQFLAFISAAPLRDLSQFVVDEFDT